MCIETLKLECILALANTKIGGQAFALEILGQSSGSLENGSLGR